MRTEGLRLSSFYIERNVNGGFIMSKIYFCYSPKLNAFLQRAGLRVIGVGNNVNTGRRFW